MKEKGTGVDWVAFFTANGVIPEQEVKTALDPIYTLMTKSVMNKMCDGSYYIALASRPAPSNGLTVEKVLEWKQDFILAMDSMQSGWAITKADAIHEVQVFSDRIIAELRREG